MKAKCAKKKLLEAFKNYPQSIRKLSAAYESFLKAIQAEQRAIVTLKALKTQYSRVGRAFGIGLQKSWNAENRMALTDVPSGGTTFDQSF